MREDDDENKNRSALWTSSGRVMNEDRFGTVAECINEFDIEMEEDYDEYHRTHQFLSQSVEKLVSLFYEQKQLTLQI